MIFIALLQLWQVGTTLHCAAQASVCSGLSYCGWNTGSRCLGFSHCSTQTQWLWHMGLLAVESSQTGGGIHIPCIGKQILIPCPTREVQGSYFWRSRNCVCHVWLSFGRQPKWKVKPDLIKTQAASDRRISIKEIVFLNYVQCWATVRQRSTSMRPDNWDKIIMVRWSLQMPIQGPSNLPLLLFTTESWWSTWRDSFQSHRYSYYPADQQFRRGCWTGVNLQGRLQ